jgi:dipeptidase E
MNLKNHLRIVAAGRGRSMCLPPILDAVLALIPSKESEFRLVYLGTATYDKDEPFQAQTSAYQQLPNCRVIKLDVSEAVDTILTESELRSTILSADVIMVSGGNTQYAINRWKTLKIDAMIQQAIETNNPSPVLCGGSAGAICWFDCGHSDSMDPTTFLYVDPNLTEEQKKDWEYIRYEHNLCISFTTWIR